jgi:uncharacterized protein (DUF697 family)
MTDSQQAKCHAIIHTHAVICAAGNLVPVPMLGFSADIVAMGSMCMCLAAVFGGSISEEVAKGLAVAALKRTLLKHPVKAVTKELVKMIPLLGQIVAPALSVTMIEAAGWCMAKDLERRANALCPAPAAG